ncbi:GNAT family N-acetyltransferase [Chamaesiphon polymorphus]|uniref:GNAT family N-acetyltransferase n=1 Tax=Chamaesiphon polymorphus CCALA 037 TaxID=2107692 RepID=A0A2T1GJZ3_9CYAN|nr:GNAT family N-acetyltransferase [Chamaesiphon polymorphus]PSB58150.1 GNAT family N-acetyltransferase [Chamaesiphon polymorphus CCALA 037]
MEINLAGIEDLDEIAKLFDCYRIFYQQPSDLEAARNFLKQRFDRSDARIFVARIEGQTVGFTQLYPSFSSVAMKPVWILNDLFVSEAYRNRGVARSLMGAVENFGRETAAIRIILSTQVANTAARSLYRSLGYIKNEEFHQYTLSL